MTNAEVTEFLKSVQHYWMKWRDNVPDPDDIAQLHQMEVEAGVPLEGMPEHATGLMMFFVEELAERVRAKETK